MARLKARQQATPAFVPVQLAAYATAAVPSFTPSQELLFREEAVEEIREALVSDGGQVQHQFTFDNGNVTAN